MTLSSPAPASPSLVSLERRVSPARGGNLASPKPDRAGHFLFPQFPHQIVGNGTYPNEAAVILPSAVSRRTRRQNRRLRAESGASLPFVHVDHFSHRGGSNRSSSRKREHNRSLFHDAGKTFHDRHR